MHPTDDLTTRGGLMVARAAAQRDALDAYWNEFARIGAETLSELQTACDAIRRVRSLSASDAALARAIDAVPGRG